MVMRMREMRVIEIRVRRKERKLEECKWRLKSTILEINLKVGWKRRKRGKVIQKIHSMTDELNKMILVPTNNTLLNNKLITVSIQ